MSSKALIKNSKPPRHVAIIMDGNGRWAKERGKPRIDGHIKGAEIISEVIEAGRDCGVKYITLYAFSSENWNRPQDEVDALMSLLTKTIKDRSRHFIENKVRFRTIGDISALPAESANAVRELKEKTKQFEEFNLVLALNYGSRDELVRALNALEKERKACANKNPMEWKDIAAHLDTSDIPDPDLLIRTSGEMRLSNYLLLQAAYAELYFTPVYWPDFGREEFIKAVKEYERRERRYGLTADQISKQC